jgi:hypothetical protein
MKTLQAVYRDGRIEALEEVHAANNTKLLIIVTDEILSPTVVSNMQDISVLEKVRRRSSSDATTEQQISSREKLKQIASRIEGKLPYQNLDEISKHLRRYDHDND